MSKIKLFGNTSAAHVAAREPRKPNRPRRHGRGRRALIAVSVVLAALAALYCLFAFSDIPFIAKWRTIYIQTAMDTMHHQWLATAFLPQSVIDEAMAARNGAMQEQTQHNSSDDWADRPDATPAPSGDNGTSENDGLSEDGFYELFWELDRGSMEDYLSEHPEALEDGWENLYINEAGLDDDGTSIRTAMGEQVLAIDVPNQILLVRVSGTGYRGVLAVAKDSSRLSVQNSAYLGDTARPRGKLPRPTAGCWP